MKVNTKALSSALNDVGRAIKTRSTLAVMSCVKLTRVDDFLQIEGTDLDNTVIRRIECADGGLEPTCVSHRLLARLVSCGDSESTELGNAGQRLIVKTKANSSIATQPVDEFPKTPSEKEIEMAILCEDLADGLEAVSWAADVNPAIGSQNGNVFVEASATVLACVAFDGKKLAYFSRPLISESRDLLIPLGFVQHLIPELREKNAALFASDNAITVRHDRGSVRVKMAEGKYFNYKQITERRQNNPGAKVDSEFLRRACSSAIALGGMDKMPCLEIIVNRDEVSVFTEDSAGTYGDKMLCEGEVSFEVSFNAHFVDDALKAMSGPTVTIVSVPGGTFFEFGDLLVAIAELPSRRKLAAQRAAQGEAVAK